jgi:hypothetical protein
MTTVAIMHYFGACSYIKRGFVLLKMPKKLLSLEMALHLHPNGRDAYQRPALWINNLCCDAMTASL